MINVIVAVEKNYGIGKDGKLPWNNKEELQIFKQKTLNSILICGRKTHDKLPSLKDREIYVVSRDRYLINNINVFNSIDFAIENAKLTNKKIFIIGGNEIYNYVFEKYKKQLILHVSMLKDSYECDTYFDKNNFKNFYIIREEIFKNFVHQEMKYNEGGENQYLNLIRDIIKNGRRRVGRNGEVISDFCNHLKFDLRDGFPLFTTKKMFTKGIIEELLFFIRGDTDTKLLEEKGINIWKGNTSREFLDCNRFEHRREGIMGTMYGYQWRFFNSPYDEINAIPMEKGIDQLYELIELIKKDPTSRRLLLTGYNPNQAKEGVLFPCHSIILQFYVDGNFLDMYCYNRSCDIGLGIGFNIASSSLLLMIISKLTNKIPRFFNLSLGDTHIYSTHIDPLKEQINRIPYYFPKIKLPEFKCLKDVEMLTYKDFIITDYNYYPSIKMEMIA
jgi:dihydrofolate reductase/thymidylate synthase